MRVLFLCPHGAAKSVIATAMTRRYAEVEGLDVTCDNAGTDPDPALNQIALDALRARGLGFDAAPRLVTTDDVGAVDVVVSFGCVEDELPTRPRRWVDWSDVPDVSSDVDGFIHTLEQRLPALLSEAAMSDDRGA